MPASRSASTCRSWPRCADKFAILRGVSHTLAAHELGTKYMNTGNRPLPSLEFPGYGAVVTKELPADPDLPPFVAIPNTPPGAGLPRRAVRRPVDQRHAQAPASRSPSAASRWAAA